jgi:hypothetical protein
MTQQELSTKTDPSPERMVIQGGHSFVHLYGGAVLTECRTPWPATVCRCGHFQLEWPATYPKPPRTNALDAVP